MLGYCNKAFALCTKSFEHYDRVLQDAVSGDWLLLWCLSMLG